METEMAWLYVVVEEVSLRTTTWPKAVVSDFPRDLGHSWFGGFTGAANVISPSYFWSGDGGAGG